MDEVGCVVLMALLIPAQRRHIKLHIKALFTVFIFTLYFIPMRFAEEGDTFRDLTCVTAAV